MSYLILVDKPQGLTSFSAVAAIKRRLGIKRVGHTGTLDPLATGLLPILTGRASRLSSLMLEAEKSYEATFRLGITTDSYDITGNIISRLPVNADFGNVKSAAESFLGASRQVPPMYSALKKDGVRLYELARRGETVEREARDIFIKSITLSGASLENEYSISVTCSKGTYIRSLVFDIGAALGCGATLTSLRRTAVSGFSLCDATPLEDIVNSTDNFFLKSPELCVAHLREVSVTQPQANRFLHGGELDFARLRGFENPCCGELFRVKFGNNFLGIGKADCAAEALKIGCIIGEETDL